MALLVHGGTVLTGDEERPVIPDGYVLIEGDTITAVGDAPPEGHDGDSIDASGMLVTPGFVNAHTHLCMIFGRNLGSDRSLLHWLSEAQVPLMAGLRARGLRAQHAARGDREPQGRQHDDL